MGLRGKRSVPLLREVKASVPHCILFIPPHHFLDGIFLATDDFSRVIFSASVPNLSLPVWQIEDKNGAWQGTPEMGDGAAERVLLVVLATCGLFFMVLLLARGC